MFLNQLSKQVQVLLSATIILSTLMILPTQALAACSGSGCVVNDAFGRSVSTGWGTVTPGGTYAFKWWNDGTSANSQAFVGSGEGSIGLDANGTQEAVVGSVGSTNYADSDTILTVETTSQGTGVVLTGPIARHTSHYEHYSALLDFNYNTLVIYWGSGDGQEGNSTLWDLATYFSRTDIEPETYYNIRFRVVGETLKAKYWEVGTSEPTSWHVETTDSSISTGKPGVLAVTFDDPGGSVANVDYYYDNFQVKNCAVDTCSATSAF